MSEADALPDARAPGQSGLPRPALARAARRVAERAPRRGHARHPPPRRALRQLRRGAVRAQGAAAAASRGTSTGCCASWPMRSCPVVEAVGVVTRSAGADGHEPEAVLITRHLDFSLPYRSLFSGPRRARSAQQPAGRARRAARRASTSRASSGATARSRTRSSGAMRARSRPTSSTPRRASCTRS